MEQLIPFISDVGFPIVVTLYLLHRIEAKLDTVVQSIQGLPARLQEKHEPEPIHSTHITQQQIREIN
ncbi:YvrJ family protein [Bacillus sp. ISL-39]|uniref:YvrJ family protein n=1 Tax=Bacillus sp. ISL-39 TaxID=2819124 RepID=UPI001BE7B9BE|nr:YvrJ family protein [Bacillus sp. ISL-39]MBT2639758.1 YvrJ family protein [Bacillus sp. ISL-39]